MDDDIPFKDVVIPSPRSLQHGLAQRLPATWNYGNVGASNTYSVSSLRR